MPGDIFDATEDAGAVLESVGAAERVVDEAADVPHKDKKRYNRRDLRAED